MRHVWLLSFCVLLSWGVAAFAQPSCLPTLTAATSVHLEWTRPALADDNYTPVDLLLRRTGTTPATMTLPFTDTSYHDTGLPPGPHGWELQAQYQHADGARRLSVLAPLGTPPPCVVVAALPPVETPAPPRDVTVGPFTTVTGVQGLDVRWTLEPAEQVAHIARRHGTDATQPFVHVGSAPQGFWFDTWGLAAGETYCYRVCLDPVAATCSAAVCAVFLGR